MRDAAAASPAATGAGNGGREETSEARGGREGTRGSSSSSNGNSRNISSGGSLAGELEAALHEPGGAEDVEEGDEAHTAAVGRQVVAELAVIYLNSLPLYL